MSFDFRILGWALACGLLACGTSDGPSTRGDATSPLRDPNVATITVVVRSAGSVTGRVASAPEGIRCPDACKATFARGERVTLTFEPEGAARVAQFYLRRAGGEGTNCNGHPAAAATTCTIDIDRDLEVEVFPISVPPVMP